MLSRMKLIFSVALFILVAISAWPAYVIASFSVSYFLDTLGLVDFIDSQPKRLLLNEFIDSWKSSAPLAAGIGLLAVIDMQLMTRQKITYFFAGLTLPLACIVLGVLFFKNNGMELIPVFAGTGIILWLVYRLSELISRIERA